MQNIIVNVTPKSNGIFQAAFVFVSRNLKFEKPMLNFHLNLLEPEKYPS